jgi:peptide/nickel transport system substrate-binding protein
MNKARLLASAALTGLFLLGGLGQHGIGHAAQRVNGPHMGGTVIDGLFEEPDRLIPNTSSETFSVMVQQTIFTPLFYTDDKGVLHPGLATQIPTAGNGGISTDGRSYTIHLRPGLKWSDGQPLDARDVDYSWRTWLNKDLIVNSTLGLDQIQSATVSADKLSITFHLKSPYAPFISTWTDQDMPLPQHVLGKMTAKQLNTSAFTNVPTVSSGPFKVVARKTGDSITEVRNPNYYQKGKPYLDKLIFRIIADYTAQINALRAGEIDCGWFLDVSQTSTLQHLNGYTFVAAASKTANVEEALLNLKNPFFQDVRVRQALEYAIDRPSMVKDVRHGNAVMAGADESPAMWSYSAADAKPYPFDPTKAGKLLDAAGWKMGSDGLRHKDGKTFSIRYSTTANNTWRAQDEAIVQQDLKNVGIDVRIVNYPASTYFGTILPGGKYDIGEFENGSAYDPDTILVGAFRSDQLPPRGANWGHYLNPAYDKLAHEEETTSDVQKRKAALGKIQAILNHDMPALWLYHPPDVAEHRNTLHNYAPAPFSSETWNTWDWYKS